MFIYGQLGSHNYLAPSTITLTVCPSSKHFNFVVLVVAFCLFQLKINLKAGNKLNYCDTS